MFASKEKIRILYVRVRALGRLRLPVEVFQQELLDVCDVWMVVEMVVDLHYLC